MELEDLLELEHYYVLRQSDPIEKVEPKNYFGLTHDENRNILPEISVLSEEGGVGEGRKPNHDSKLSSFKWYLPVKIHELEEFSHSFC